LRYFFHIRLKSVKENILIALYSIVIEKITQDYKLLISFIIIGKYNTILKQLSQISINYTPSWI